jgi:hypothetical protein
MYGYVLMAMMLFTCAREEDKRRKFAARAYTFNEFRMLALNVEYVEYEKHKNDLIWGSMKFGIQNLPQFIL